MLKQKLEEELKEFKEHGFEPSEFYTVKFEVYQDGRFLFHFDQAEDISNYNDGDCIEEEDDIERFSETYAIVQTEDSEIISSAMKSYSKFAEVIEDKISYMQEYVHNVRRNLKKYKQTS
jgi:hypothetical protein